MTITPASFKNPPCSLPRRESRQTVRGGLAGDTFIRRPSALDNVKSAYQNSVYHLIQDAAQDENLLGIGSRARVYRIPKAATELVLHIQNGVNVHELPVNLTLKAVLDPLPEVNIGQPIASSPDGKIKVLRYQSGVNSAIPYYQFFEKYGIDDLLSKHKAMKSEDTRNWRKKYADHLDKVATLPQAAYDDLAKRFIQIKNKGLFIDPCGLNILVDTNKGCFNSVDHQEKIGPYQNVLGMACALTDTMFVDLDGHSQPDCKEAQGTVASQPELILRRSQILKKTFLATLRTGLDTPEEACPLNEFNTRQRSFGIDYACNVSGFKGKWRDIQLLLKQAKAAQAEGVIPEKELEATFLKALDDLQDNKHVTKHYGVPHEPDQKVACLSYS